MNLLKKENLLRKSCFQIMLSEVLKNDIEITRNKRSSHCILQVFYKKYLQNLKHNLKNVGYYSIHLDIVR